MAPWQDLAGLLSEIVVGAIIAIVASYVTVRLSLRRFYHEKWWEKKAEAYSAVLEALHYMKRSFDEDLEEEFGVRKVSEERKKQLQEKYREAYDELKKRIDIGQFVLSDEAVRELTEFEKAYNKASDRIHWFEYIEGSWTAINNALNQMRRIARTDLKAPL